MPFFPEAHFFPRADFVQLLSELDQPQIKACGSRHIKSQTFTPRFDVTEVAQAYELYGELPGIERKDISINFTDAQTLIIKGKTERASSMIQADDIAKSESTRDSETTSDKTHNATVEDEYDEADIPLSTPGSTTTAIESDAAAEQQNKGEAHTSKPRFWVAERRAGSFIRSFSFSQRVEHDSVKATLKNGILYIVVPKSQKLGKIRVTVS